MKFLALVLLAAIFVRHDTAFWLAPRIGISPAGTFHLLGGALEVLLCAAVLVLLLTYRASIWLQLAQAAAVIGMVEGSMIAACRIALQKPVPAGMTQCDFVTGLPIGAVVTTMEVLALCWIMGAWLRRGAGE